MAGSVDLILGSGILLWRVRAVTLGDVSLGALRSVQGIMGFRHQHHHHAAAALQQCDVAARQDDSAQSGQFSQKEREIPLPKEPQVRDGRVVHMKASVSESRGKHVTQTRRVEAKKKKQQL